jgi:hypothetical protein
MRQCCKSLLLLNALLVTSQAARLPISTYRGMCDASAAVALNANYFAAASDEDSIIRVFHSDTPGNPVATFDFGPSLALTGRNRETDLEGAARIRDVVYWISSHGRNKNGEARPNRQRLFATRIKTSGAAPELVLEGRAYSRLLLDISKAPFAKRLGLDAAMRKAPKAEDGLNIEGLAATPDGSLLIAFRNPIPDNKALLIPLLNPLELLQGNASSKFGEPSLIDLGGSGIRDIALFKNEFVIVAGKYDSHHGSKLFRWAGGTAVPERIDVKVNYLNPEALVCYAQPGESEFQVLSDDGEKKTKDIECKQLPPRQRTFRAVSVSIK